MWGAGVCWVSVWAVGVCMLERPSKTKSGERGTGGRPWLELPFTIPPTPSPHAKQNKKNQPTARQGGSTPEPRTQPQRQRQQQDTTKQRTGVDDRDDNTVHGGGRLMITTTTTTTMTMMTMHVQKLGSNTNSDSWKQKRTKTHDTKREERNAEKFATQGRKNPINP